MAQLETQIGDAWQALRQGRHSEAVSSFEALARSNPDDLDAQYGLGLAYRAAGRHEAALSIFQATLDAAQARYDQLRAEAGRDNLLNTNVDDRLMMLVRMLSQRIDEVKRLA